MVIPPSLIEEIRKKSKAPSWTGLLFPAIETLRARYPGVEAIIFYGSCLERADPFEGILDLYLLVSNYREAYGKTWLALANRLLPPNVFFFVQESPSGILRFKVAVMELGQFLKATSPHWFHSYFWARFAQPAVVLYASREDALETVLKAFSQAVLTFLTNVFPLLPEEGTIKALWLEGLRWSYRAELRPEPPGRLERLWESYGKDLTLITKAAVPGLPFRVEVIGEHYRSFIPSRLRRKVYWSWRGRVVQGKVLSLLRLIKAAFTFEGGVDYALWKIKRHTGLEIEIPKTLRDRPLLALFLYGWRVWKLGGIK